MLARNAPGVSPVARELKRRLRWLMVFLAALFCLLVGRLWQLQIVRGEQYYERARQNVVATQFLSSVRGKIVDRHGVVLANNRPAFNIYITPKSFDRGQRTVLTKVLQLTEEELELLDTRVATGRKRDPATPVLVLSDQGRDRAALIAQRHIPGIGNELSAVEVRDEPHRHYPQGRLAAHLLGYMNQLTAKELEELGPMGYSASEFIGRDGLEKQWEHYLRGKKGIERFVVNARRERVDEASAEADDLIEEPRHVAPVAGHNVILTIDSRLQQQVEAAVAKHAAAGVAVVDVRTGQILALVSTPAFDPNVMTGKLTAEALARMNADPRKPFLDKTLDQHYPPGSTFKFIPAAIAIDDGLVSVEEQLLCVGYHEQGRRKFRCTSSHGRIGLLEAIQRSCNVYFWKLSEQIGLDRIAELALEFGFAAPTGMGLNHDVPGRMPTRAWYEQRDTFKIGYTLNAATGQGDVEVTVLQVAMAYAAIANGGRLHVPQVVRRVETAKGQIVARYEPVVRRKIKVSDTALELLRDGMRRVVNVPGGTAYDHAHSTQVEFAGKTGTAQVRARRKEAADLQGWDPRRDHAWFAGFAPTTAPEIAVAVLIEHGGSGGKVAGPVARDVIESYFRLKRDKNQKPGGTE